MASLAGARPASAGRCAVPAILRPGVASRCAKLRSVQSGNGPLGSSSSRPTPSHTTQLSARGTACRVAQPLRGDDAAVQLPPPPPQPQPVVIAGVAVPPKLVRLFFALRVALNRLYSGVLPGPARFLPTFLLPASVALAAMGAAHGAAAWLALTGLVASASQQVTVLQAVVPLLQLRALRWMAPVALSLSGGIFVFVLMPALDLLMGEESDDGAEAAEEHRSGLYRGVLYSYATFHFVLLASACWLVATHPAMSPWAFFGLVLSMGCEGGLVFTAAHELLHSPHPGDRWLADALLASMCYMHWGQSHLAHHQKVATPEDPSSARRGESFYAFLPRTVLGNVADGYGMEAARMRRYGLPWYSLHNRMLVWVLSPLAIAAALHAAFGAAGLALFVGQAAAGVVMLELINFIEHYGLSRRKLPSGRYERVGTAHSWNANSLFTNSVIFRLQRHTDHHTHPNKPFHLLESCSSAPQLPWSYSCMSLLALVPPLWFRVMDPRVDAWAATHHGAGAPPPLQ